MFYIINKEMSLDRLKRQQEIQEAHFHPHRSGGYSQNNEREESGCCYDKNDQLEYGLNQTWCLKCLLVVFRIVAFAALCVRFFFNSRDGTASLFIIFKFLTDLGFSMTLIFYSLCMFDLLLNSRGSNKTIPKLAKTASILYQVVFPTEVIVTALYWIIVYDGTHTTADQWILDIGNHGFPLVLLAIDFIFNLVPFYTRHVLPLLVFIVFYLLTNLGYTLAIGPIYSAIDWRSGSSYAWVFVSVFVMVAFHFLCQLIWYKCKRPKLEDILEKESR